MDLAAALAQKIDELFARFAFRGKRSRRSAPPGSIRARIREAEALYPAADAKGRLFPAPNPANLTRSRVRALPGGEVLDVRWESRYEPLHASFEELLRRCPEDRTCHARLLRHEQPSPAIVCLHGWGGGRFSFEERAFRAEWLYGLGLDVALFALPFHGPRAPAGSRRPIFPSPDPVKTNEGFAQAISDLRALMGALRDTGAPSVGVCGMSLGGFTAALLATVDPALDYAIPLIPFASLPELLWGHGSGTKARAKAQEAGVDLATFTAAFRATSPVARPPVIPSDRVLVVAGERDRVTPKDHAARLHAQFPGSRLSHFRGAHLVQLGRGAMFEEIRTHLERLGVIGPGRPPHGVGDRG